MTSEALLRKRWEAAHNRASQGAVLGWAAMVQSFRADMARIECRMRELGLALPEVQPAFEYPAASPGIPIPDPTVRAAKVVVPPKPKPPRVVTHAQHFWPTEYKPIPGTTPDRILRLMEAGAEHYVADICMAVHGERRENFGYAMHRLILHGAVERTGKGWYRVKDLRPAASDRGAKTARGGNGLTSSEVTERPIPSCCGVSPCVCARPPRPKASGPRIAVAE